MQKCLRAALLATFLFLLGVSTAPAQTYELVADSTELAPSNDTTDVQCLVQLSSGTHVFFNGNAEAIYTWDGSALSVHRSASDLNGDVPDESNNFDSCDGVASADGFVYFVLRSSETDDNYIYRTEAADPSNNDFQPFGGANGLAATTSTLYIAGYEFFGSPADGIWEINSDFSNDTTAVATNGSLSIEVIDVAEDGTLYGFSNNFGDGDFASSVFSFDPTASSPSFSLFSNPYNSSSPLSQTGNEITDLEAITFNGTGYLVVYNESFDASSGEEWGTIKVSDQSIDLLFTQNDLLSNTSASGYAGGTTEPMVANSSGEIYAASRFRADDATDYIAKVSGAPPLPVEMTSFDAVQNGSSVTLTWQTASETNNAGFRVQHRTESGWTSLGFVDSKATGGTTTEAQSYRFDVKQELSPGTHRFRLKQKDLDGTAHLSDVVSVTLQMEDAISLSAPSPNPVRQQATISFAVKKEGTDATVSVFNTLGQEVTTLYQGTPPAGEAKTLTFSTDGLPSGLYLVRLQADGQTRTQRVTVVR